MGPTGSPTGNPKDNHNPTNEPTNIKDDTHTDIHHNFLAAQHPVLRTLLDINYEVDTDSNPKPTGHPDQQPPEPIRFKWKQIKDDPEWLLSCYQQLDQYEDQDMFDKPQPKPNDANAWPLVWTFLLKPDRKKARCTVDGSKRWQRNIQLGQTYANSLATDSERLFWAIAAKRGLLVVGADVSNAFAEAPAPGNTFYIIPDHIFHSWWVNHKKRQPIPPGWVLRVKFALQGHPESPRLWEQHIRKILTGKLGYQSMHHERCLYQAVLYGHWTMLLRQVDDFAFAVETETIGRNIVNNIDQHLRIRIKYLGVLKMFNGMDITQTKYYIKLHCTSHITRIIQQHQWTETTTKLYPIPYPADNTYTKLLDTAIPPDTITAQQNLSQQ
jgi:hypothetical protein